MSAEEENKRISIQVTNLSTQLMDAIQSQSTMEQKLAHSEREAAQLKAQLKEKENIEKRSRLLLVENKELITRVNGLEERLQTEIKAKLEARDNVASLEKEVEELTATLFEEANVMVSDARKETEQVKERNASLVKQLREKDELVNDLENQLKVLKDVLHERDQDLDDAGSERNSTAFSPSANSVSNPSSPHLLQKQVLYSPTIDAIRYDLKLFAEFKKFLKTVKDYDTIRDTETKFIKRLLTDEVEPALRLDTAPGISYFNRRTTITSIIDGRVSIEPVSGINETYRLNFQNDKVQDTDVKSNLYSYPPHSPPVAMEQPCAICGENRNDILEHSRLYIMKVYSKQDSTNNVAASAASSPTVAHQYPLCSYCLIRLRSVSELFAFLRSLKTDAWKLNNEVMVKKAWIEFARLRSKLFWAKIGIWDVDNNVVTTKISASTEDYTYKSIAGTADPSRLSMYSSTDSLADSKVQDANANGYRSSPLINQVQQSPQSVKGPNDPRTPLRLVSTETSSIPSEEEIATEQIDSSEPLSSTNPEVKETRTGEDEYDDDDVDDIIGDYSHDEGEPDQDEDKVEEHATVGDTTDGTISQKTSGLQIQTEQEEFRPQDTLLDSEQSTPVINRANSQFGTEEGDENQREISKDSTTTNTDDETEFVDA